MVVKFFGQYLLDKGVITRDQLLDAINHQKEISKPLCTLALEKGYLSAEQIAEMEAERIKSDKKFMGIALDRKILSFEQLEQLYKVKTERWIFLGEALVERGHLSLTQLGELLKEYRRQLPVEEGPLERVLAGVKGRDIISAMLQVTVDLFIHYTKKIVQVVSVENAAREPEGVAYLLSQKVTGDRTFHYALALPEELTLAIASHMMGAEQAEVTPTVLDAVTEFANVVVGNGCARLSLKNVKVAADPPRIMTKETLSKIKPSEIISVNMKTIKGTFRVLFFFEAEPPKA